jgi:hypothetical protein
MLLVPVGGRGEWSTSYGLGDLGRIGRLFCVLTNLLVIPAVVIILILFGVDAAPDPRVVWVDRGATMPHDRCWGDALHVLLLRGDRDGDLDSGLARTSHRFAPPFPGLW